MWGMVSLYNLPLSYLKEKIRRSYLRIKLTFTTVTYVAYSKNITIAGWKNISWQNLWHCKWKENRKLIVIACLCNSNLCNTEFQYLCLRFIVGTVSISQATSTTWRTTACSTSSQVSPVALYCVSVHLSSLSPGVCVKGGTLDFRRPVQVKNKMTKP